MTIRGAVGIDGQTLQTIEERGVDEFINQLQEELKAGPHWPQAVRRVNIPKPDGRQRPLGIPVVRDRVVPAAMKIVIEPIFEADFEGVPSTLPIVMFLMHVIAVPGAHRGSKPQLIPALLGRSRPAALSAASAFAFPPTAKSFSSLADVAPTGRLIFRDLRFGQWRYDQSPVDH